MFGQESLLFIKVNWGVKIGETSEKHLKLFAVCFFLLLLFFQVKSQTNHFAYAMTVLPGEKYNMHLSGTLGNG